MPLHAASAVLLATLVSPSHSRTPSVAVDYAPADTNARFGAVRLIELPSVRRLFTKLAPQRASKDEGERAAAWADFSLLVAAVAGDQRLDPVVFEGRAEATGIAQEAHVRTTPDLVLRDRAAYQLLGLGYSARETADVVGGRISRQALDTARKMLLVGRGAEAAANYLDGEYKRVVATNVPPAVGPPDRPDGSSSRFDSLIAKYAAIHNVDPAVVRAVIVAESAFDPAARSHAGAIGLMQLMPATAHALGVDPTIPDQNIEGGVRYLSELLRMFGGIELALVAYNGGPGFARRYLRGETALYGETREYVKKVLSGLTHR